MKFLISWLLIFSIASAQAQTYIQGPNLIEVPTTTATAAGTTTLTSASRKNQQFTGSTTQSVKLPNATTLQQGRSFYISNASTGIVTIKYNDSSTARALPGNSQAYLILEDNSTSNGTWDISNGSAALGVGTIDSQSAVANGAQIVSNLLYMQSEDATHPGLLNNSAQTISGAKTFSSVILGPAGSNTTPTFSFSTDTDSGMYSTGPNDLVISTGTYPGIEIAKSAGAYSNVGMGGTPPSGSDQYPLLIQRAIPSGGVIAQITNTHTDPNSAAKIQLSSDAGNNLAELAVYTASSTVDAYISAMTIRPSSSTAKLSLIGGDLATGYVTTYTGGDYASTGETTRFNADHTGQFMQSVASPTSPAAGLKFYNNAGVFSSKTTGGTVSSFAGVNSGDVTIATFGSSPTANAASISGQAITLQPADGTNPGSITAGTQTIGGAKTFSAAPVFSSVTASQALVVDSGKALSSLAYTNANTASTLVQRDGSGNFSAGTISAALSGNATTATTATTATNATNTAITDDTTTNATMYPTWVTAATGNLPQKVSSSKITFNPSTAVLTTTTFAGALTGTASGNTTYTANNHGMVVSSATNAMTVVAPDASTTKVWTSGGASADPSWAAVTASSFGTQTAGTFLAGPTSGSNATPTFRALQAPTYQVFSSGTAATYTTPAGVLYLKVRMVGGGGGGGSSGTGSWGAATAGGVTTFGNLTANNGGAGGQSGNVAGGTASGGAGWTTIYTTTGGSGGGSSFNTSNGDTQTAGGTGGSSPLGPGGGGGYYGAVGADGKGAGSGGGGGGSGSGLSGQYTGGGGSGAGYIEARTSGAPSATYTYTVGAAGAAGTAGTNGFAGGAGQAGYIIVEEYYQ